jgi:hypothetical protein
MHEATKVLRYASCDAPGQSAGFFHGSSPRAEHRSRDAYGYFLAEKGSDHSGEGRRSAA